MSVSPITAAPSVRFAVTARALGDAARAIGCTIPGFRTPPRLPDVDRSIKRSPRGAVVSVRVKGRPFSAVVADMVEGVVVTNAFTGAQASRCRAAMWEAALAVEALDDTHTAATPPDVAGRDSDLAA